jgi:hypothetical protein
MDKTFFELFNRKEFIFQTFSDKYYEAQNTVNGKDTLVKVFKTTPEQAEASIEALQSKGAGIFFQVNPGTSRRQRDVESVAALFLDLDGAPLEPVLEDARAGKIAKPNAIVLSSEGRYHAYWLVHDCELLMFRQAQKALAARYGGDPVVHNLERVMRVPGTKNFKTTAEGYSTKCKIIHRDTHSVHDVVDINEPPAQAPSHTARAMMGDEWGDLDDNAYNVTELRAGDRTEAIISEAGRYIATTPGADYGDTMKHLRAWERKLLRAGDPPKTQESWDTEIVPGVLRFLNSKQDEIDTIERRKNATIAKIKAVDPESGAAWDSLTSEEAMEYQAFVDRFIYVSSEDKVYDLQKQANAEPWKLSSFKVWAAPHRIGKGSMVTKWLNDLKARKTAHIATYQPRPWATEGEAHMGRVVMDELTNVTAYNTYQQPMVVPADTLDDEKVKPFINHIKYLCNDDETLYSYLLDWIAYTVQVPQERIPTVPLIISKPGVGKGWLCECMTHLLGDKNVNSLDMSKFAANNQFNGFMVNCKMVVVHETKATRKVVESLKALVTEKALDINIKYGANKKQHIYANMLMFSNHDDAMPLDEGDRRYVVIRHMGEARTPEYYNVLFEWIKSDGLQHLFRYLLDRDLSQFDFAAPAMMTTAKMAMIQASRNENLQIIIDAVNNYEGVFKLDVVPGAMVVRHVEAVKGTVLEHSDRIRLFRQIGDGYVRFIGRGMRNGKRDNMYAVRNLEKYKEPSAAVLRDYFDKAAEIELESNKLKTVR